jgi:ion channel-forming bestrophin family protein
VAAPPPHRIVPHLAVLPRLALILVPIGFYVYLVCRFEEEHPLGLNDLGLEASILSGIILSILLGFRNNAADSRWWEARKLWGQLVNDSRNFSLKVAAHPMLGADDRSAVARLLVGFAHALKLRLRGVGDLAAVPGFDHDELAASHVPQSLAGRLFELLNAWRTAGKIDGYDLLAFDVHARGLMDVCGACERIRGTPLAASYRALLRIGIGVYLFISPIYVVRDFGRWAVPIVVLVAFFLLGVEMVAHDVEEPFGAEGDDLPLDRYCETIEASMREVLR